MQGAWAGGRFLRGRTTEAKRPSSIRVLTPSATSSVASHRRAPGHGQGWPQAWQPAVCPKPRVGSDAQMTSTLQQTARVLTGVDLLEVCLVFFPLLYIWYLQYYPAYIRGLAIICRMDGWMGGWMMGG